MPKPTPIMRQIKKQPTLQGQLYIAEELATTENVDQYPDLVADLAIWISTKLEPTERAENDDLSKAFAKTLMAITNNIISSLMKLANQDEYRKWVISFLVEAMACINKSVHSSDYLYRMIANIKKCGIPIINQNDEELTSDEIKSLINLGTFSYALNSEKTKLIMIKG